jgi:phosphoribosylamine---glycine ligase
MRILVVGSGAREHALVWKCLRSPLAERIYVAPGNGGTAAIARNVAVQADDAPQLARLARKQKIDLAILGPEAAIAAGVGDALRDADVPVFGPSRNAGRIENSKAFAKEVMVAAGIPTAAFATFTDAEPARRYARKLDGRVAVKADGLALGKGVIVCGSRQEADEAIDAMLVRHSFGRAGATVVVEERLEGPEVSVFGLCDGSRVVPLEAARDFKRARDGDEGPNTGGMGAYSPPAGVGDDLVLEATRTVLRPALHELGNRDLDYRGVLYAGLMLTSDGIKVLEFNARFGDPETQVVLPRLQSDLVPLLLAAAMGHLPWRRPRMDWSDQPAVGVVVASRGYPDAYQTGFEVQGLNTIPEGVLIFHAGTRLVSSRGLVTSGGRVLTTVGMGADVDEARMRALSGAVRVRFPGAFFRKDIAQEAAVGA